MALRTSRRPALVLNRRGSHSRRIALVLGLGLTLAFLGGPVFAGYQTADYQLVESGQLTVGTSPDYPPAEFIDPDQSGADSFVGYDMDLARELADRLGLEFNPQRASFDILISDLTGPPLGEQRYDIAVSAFTITPDRLEQVDMIPYFRFGESLLVPEGNPNDIEGIADLCGLPVAVQSGSFQLAELTDANGEGDGSTGQEPVCQDDPIQILSFASADQSIGQVLNGRAAASYQDQPITSYYVSQNPDELEVGGITVAPAPVGIAVRQDNPALQEALRQALADMMADGTYLAILEEWGVADGACQNPECTVPEETEATPSPSA